MAKPKRAKRHKSKRINKVRVRRAPAPPRVSFSTLFRVVRLLASVTRRDRATSVEYRPRHESGSLRAAYVLLRRADLSGNDIPVRMYRIGQTGCNI